MTEGGSVSIAITDIVSGKPVPPKPSVRLREPLAAMERRASQDWPPEESEPLGEWLLRSAGGYSRRANSALALGDHPFDGIAHRLRTVLLEDLARGD